MSVPKQNKLGIPFASQKNANLVESEVAREIVRHIMEQTIANIPAENYFRFDHGKRWSWLVIGEGGVAREQYGEMQHVSAGLSIEKQKIIQQNAELVQNSISVLSSEMGDKMNSSVLERMKEYAEEKGVMFQIKPSGIPIEQYFEIVSKLTLTISKNGEVELPSLFGIPPEIQAKLQLDLQNAPEEFKEKLEALCSKKIEEARKAEAMRLAKYDLVE
jgi:hypothetical protein